MPPEKMQAFFREKALSQAGHKVNKFFKKFNRYALIYLCFLIFFRVHIFF